MRWESLILASMLILFGAGGVLVYEMQSLTPVESIQSVAGAPKSHSGVARSSNVAPSPVGAAHPPEVARVLALLPTLKISRDADPGRLVQDLGLERATLKSPSPAGPGKQLSYDLGSGYECRITISAERGATVAVATQREVLYPYRHNDQLITGDERTASRPGASQR